MILRDSEARREEIRRQRQAQRGGCHDFVARARFVRFQHPRNPSTYRMSRSSALEAGCEDYCDSTLSRRMPFACRDEFSTRAGSQQEKRILCDYGAQDESSFDAQPHVWEQERIISVVAPGFLYCGYTLEILAPSFVRLHSRSSAGNRF